MLTICLNYHIVTNKLLLKMVCSRKMQGNFTSISIALHLKMRI